MNLASYASLSTTAATSALRSAAQLAPAAAQAATGHGTLTLGAAPAELATRAAAKQVAAPVALSTVLHKSSPVDVLRGSKAEAYLQPLGWAAAEKSIATVRDQRHALPVGADPHVLGVPPMSRNGVGDLVSKWVTQGMGLFFFMDQPNVDAHALTDTIQRVARDVCRNWKPGEDLGGKLQAAIGFALWGAGVSPEKMQEAAEITSQLTRLGSTPEELGATLNQLL
ncbi:MAG: hypothetical protein ACAI43_09740 [Phycisphaerae bacterium]|nr:hypothetical protein [Tepidisphaeraceae bacterium]